MIELLQVDRICFINLLVVLRVKRKDGSTPGVADEKNAVGAECKELIDLTSAVPVTKPSRNTSLRLVAAKCNDQSRSMPESNMSFSLNGWILRYES